MFKFFRNLYYNVFYKDESISKNICIILIFLTPYAFFTGVALDQNFILHLFEGILFSVLVSLLIWFGYNITKVIKNWENKY